MTTEQKASNKAESDFCAAEVIADKRKLYDVERWAFICGYLQFKLASAYEKAA